MENKPSLLRTLGTYTAKVFGGFVSIVGATAVMVAYQKDQQDKEKNYTLVREAAMYGLEVDKYHEKYSLCMQTLTKFKLKYPNDYADIFLNKMKNGDSRTDDIINVNSCRSLTKTYWRMVMKYKGAYGRLITDVEYQEFKNQHKRFRELVQPLDNLDGYDDTEKIVYKIFE